MSEKEPQRSPTCAFVELHHIVTARFAENQCLSDLLAAWRGRILGYVQFGSRTRSAAMYRYPYTRPAERLMTIEEAKQLSSQDEHYDARTGRRITPPRNIWSWQSVEGALAQTVTEAQIDEVLKQR
jgi:hypothetical protein